MTHLYNTSGQGAESHGLPQVQWQPWLHHEVQGKLGLSISKDKKKGWRADSMVQSTLLLVTN